MILIFLSINEYRSDPDMGGGGAHPKKNQKKPKKNKPIYQFWCSDWFFLVFFGFFFRFFFGFFLFFFSFFCFFWNDILTLNLNTKKPKNPIKTKKNQKKTNGAQKTSFQFRMLANAYAKKTKKNQKKTSFQFRILAKTNAKKPKKTKKKPKKTNANLEI